MSIVQRLRNPALGKPEEANWGTGNQGFKEPIPGELSIHAPHPPGGKLDVPFPTKSKWETANARGRPGKVTFGMRLAKSKLYGLFCSEF